MQDKLKKEMFSDELYPSKKAKVKFQIRDNAVSILKPNRNVSYAALEQKNSAFQRLKNTGSVFV